MGRATGILLCKYINTKCVNLISEQSIINQVRTMQGARGIHRAGGQDEPRATRTYRCPVRGGLALSSVVSTSSYSLISMRGA